MSASGWIYSVPYQNDLEQALQALRQHVFKICQYGSLYPGAKKAPQNWGKVSHITRLTLEQKTRYNEQQRMIIARKTTGMRLAAFEQAATKRALEFAGDWKRGYGGPGGVGETIHV